jgi:outer membrane protein
MDTILLKPSSLPPLLIPVVLALVLLGRAMPAGAQTGEAAAAAADAASPAASTPTGSPWSDLVAKLSPGPPDDPAAPRQWEGAVGIVAWRNPTYQGSASAHVSAKPAIFLRYGRWTITSSGGFVDRRSEVVEGGLTGELLRSDDVVVKISARVDNGRDANTDPALSGQHDVSPTLRARLSAVKYFGRDWKLTAALSPDVLGRGGGVTADLGLGRDWVFAPYEHVIRVNTGGALSWANARYMQSYFGVSPDESPTVGKPVYTPGRDRKSVV